MLLRRSVVPVVSATKSHGRQTSTLSSCAFRYNTPSVEQVQRFEKYGFLQVDSAFSRSFVERVSVGIDDVFVGKQETGVYPDEWYWRPEVSRPEVTRHGTNFWKVILHNSNCSVSQ
jgi:phytanoyl-CoA hydroxylase